MLISLLYYTSPLHLGPRFSSSASWSGRDLKSWRNSCPQLAIGIPNLKLHTKGNGSCVDVAVLGLRLHPPHHHKLKHLFIYCLQPFESKKEILRGADCYAVLETCGFLLAKSHLGQMGTSRLTSCGQIHVICFVCGIISAGTTLETFRHNLRMFGSGVSSWVSFSAMVPTDNFSGAHKRF